MVKLYRQQQHAEHRLHPFSVSQVELPFCSIHMISHAGTINMNLLPFHPHFLKHPLMDRTFTVKQFLLSRTREPLLFNAPLPRLSPLDRDRDKKQMNRHVRSPPFYAKNRRRKTLLRLSIQKAAENETTPLLRPDCCLLLTVHVHSRSAEGRIAF
ncbi:hypothetical protein GTNG_2471 [Geobacillus thermodenitrificans NG80-2]|uniref:Uncharacterized protein n=1 Tax=Geobacillus thermodenitrificans (strain NG80-2) TaxID=420246 RepID=A4IR62_GEOTN|nr:hypothetical protein GTNG_2471 [Geobacillus thermodenitrificans NG80-2]